MGLLPGSDQLMHVNAVKQLAECLEQRKCALSLPVIGTERQAELP